MSDYFTYVPLTANTVARAADVNSRFQGVSAAFDMLPPPQYLAEDRLTFAADTALAAGDIVSGQVLDLTYDGAAFRLAMAFADISPAGVAAKIAAAGNIDVNGFLSADAIQQNGNTIDALSPLGVQLVEAISQSAAHTVLGLGTMALASTSTYATAAALASYAPLASPALTGTPTAPTAAPGTNTTQIATTAFVTAAVGAGGAAPIASPTFTGDPKAPTPATSDNDTSIATTAYVKANLASYATTASLASYAPLASPSFTGVPLAPTQATGDNSTALATTAHVKANLAGYAPLASPALTGTPTAPTAVGGTNTTQVATTAFVTSAVSGINLSSYAPLASPALTGTPTAPTAATATNTTQVATTAYVQANLTARSAAANTWTGTNLFEKSGGSISGGTSVTNLEVKGVSTSGAFMSFHRPGAAGVHFGMDTDGALRIGGFSWGTNVWSLTSTGNMTAAGTITSANVVANTSMTIADGAEGRLNFTATGGYTYGSPTHWGFFKAGGAHFRVNVATGEVNTNGGAIYAGIIHAQSPNSTTTGGFRLLGDAANLAYFQVVNSSMSVEWGHWRYNNTGQAYWSGSLSIQGNITSVSDMRLKTDIRPLDHALLMTSQLNGVRYRKDGQEEVGVIAQNVQEVLPEIVHDIGDGMLGVDYGRLTAVLIEAVKELTARVKELEARG
jgi:hypothetical protein